VGHQRDSARLVVAASPEAAETEALKLESTTSKGPFGWTFEPAFAFVKAKSQPKGPKATSAFPQKQLFS